jgi:hypothetical protein
MAAEEYELKYIQKNLTEKDLFDTIFYDRHLSDQHLVKSATRIPRE